MDPQNQQNAPENNQQPISQDTSAEQWFHNIEIAPAKPARKLTKSTVIISLLCLLTLAASGVLLVLAQKNKACLGTDDYQALTGSPYEDGELSSKDNLFTYTVYFTDGTASYDESADPKGEDIVSNIGKFYKSHEKKSIVIELDADYSDDANLSITNDRLTKIANGLTSAGVPNTVLIKNAPAKFEAEEEAESVKIATITIRSDTTCKE